MFALRERRVHVTQEDFELAVSKVRLLPLELRPMAISQVMKKDSEKNTSLKKFFK